ncbi:LOW QUALITY PROTEIN: transformer-2 protein homolog alpha [Odontesthes bonariensis]|uniref:LOW QUALITY PROTEIN: transformer-2 protein homolog alpha n=1 Tax=Odontesthes bonariensis TaxID=219752 RepID=UPI003F58FFDF
MFRVQLKMSQRHSRRHSSRRCSRSRSRSGSHGRKSHSRSCSPGYCRRRSLSTSPMSNLRRHAGSRSHNFTKEAYSHGRGADIRANPDPSTCVGLFGLSVYTTECDLKEVFSSYGPLAGVNVVDDQRTGCFRGFAFVYFERLDDSKVAMELANGVELEGRRIRVDYSITKRPHTPKPGIYMGRPTHNGGGSGSSSSSSSSKRRDSYYDSGYDRYDECSPSPYCSPYRSRSRSDSPRRY